MPLRADTRRHLIVAAVFAALIGLALAFQAWRSSRPTPLQECMRRCAGVHRDGRLVYDGPDSSKITDAGRVCRCQ